MYKSMAGAYQSEAHFRCSNPLPQTLGWAGNTLDYYEHSQITEEKMGPGANSIKLFTGVIYGFS
jgi:hypothetical protein